jgi:hypothetical protein
MEQIAQRKGAKEFFCKENSEGEGRMREYEIKLLSCFDPLLCPALNRVHPGPLPMGEGINGIAA